MPTLELSLSETTYTTLRQAAKRRSQPIEHLVEDALNAFLQPSTSSEESAGNGSSARTNDWRRAKIHTEAWRSLPATVRHSYGEDFVAVHNGQVVDHDRDRLTLYRRIRARFGDVPVLITPASASSPREFQLLSPPWSDGTLFRRLHSIMTESMVNRPTPREQQVAHLIQQFTPQEIGQLVEHVPSLRRPAQGKRVRYDIVGQDMREYVLKELAALGDEYRPMQADDPFAGGMSVDEFFGLPEEVQARLWDEQHQMDMIAFLS